MCCNWNVVETLSSQTKQKDRQDKNHSRIKTTTYTVYSKFTGPVNASDFDRMIADSMKDLDDEDVSDTEDPDLLVSSEFTKQHFQSLE